MNVCAKLFSLVLGLAMCAAWPATAQVQEKQQHVVSVEELNKEAAQPGETREGNGNAIRHLLSSDVGRKALKGASVDYQRVDKAIGRLSDEELARLAERSRKAESDFAAGSISAKTLAYIILIVVVIVVIAVLV